MTDYGNFGARLQPDGHTRFRLWAPDCATVSLEIEGLPAAAMRKDQAGFFEIDIRCEPGSRYRYRIADDLTVPDPASRAQSGDVHDASVVVAPYHAWRTNWQGRPWHEAVVYELHPGAFGGFAGITAQLPRLAALGITAIELMPIADFPGRRNWGYDGVLPYAPDTVYGTPAELKTLIDEAHSLGLMMILDVVYNHFGPDGNYLHAYASKFFREDIHTPWGAAIDFRQPQVQRFFIENALYWLQEFRFDGLRFDAVHAIKDDDFLLNMATEIRAAVHDRPVHLILENENNDADLLASQAYNAQWTDDWHHCVHVLLTGEHEGYYGDFQNPAVQLARCLSQGFAYQGEPSAHAGGAPRGKPADHLPTTCFVICLQNHDQTGNRAMGERPSVLATPAALRAAVCLLLLTPQIPMLFMGEEWGETKPFLFFTDHHGELAELVREGRRREFAHFSAFADEQKRQQIPDPNAEATFTASVPMPPAAPTEEQSALLALYRQALALRAQHITPRLPGTGAHGAYAIGSHAVRASWLMGDGAVLTIASNFGADAIACEAGPGEILLTTLPDAYTADTLAAFATCIWLAVP